MSAPDTLAPPVAPNEAGALFLAKLLEDRAMLQLHHLRESQPSRVTPGGTFDVHVTPEDLQGDLRSLRLVGAAIRARQKLANRRQLPGKNQRRVVQPAEATFVIGLGSLNETLLALDVAYGLADPVPEYSGPGEHETHEDAFQRWLSAAFERYNTAGQYFIRELERIRRRTARQMADLRAHGTKAHDGGAAEGGEPAGDA